MEKRQLKLSKTGKYKRYRQLTVIASANEINRTSINEKVAWPGTNIQFDLRLLLVFEKLFHIVPICSNCLWICERSGKFT